MCSLQLMRSFFVFFLCIQIAIASELRCLVCQEVVNEISSAVSGEDPRKTIQVGSFRIEPDGSQKQSSIKYAGSELHLTEVLETICNALDNYAQAKHKETGKLTLLNLTKDVSKLSTYDLVPDPELNRSLKYYCEAFVEDFEDDILSAFKSSEVLDSDLSVKLCNGSAGYCKSSYRVEL